MREKQRRRYSERSELSCRIRACPPYILQIMARQSVAGRGQQTRVTRTMGHCALPWQAASPPGKACSPILRAEWLNEPMKHLGGINSLAKTELAGELDMRKERTVVVLCIALKHDFPSYVF